MRTPSDNHLIWTPGPWEHKLLAANGAQFHVVRAGEHSATRPLIILAHTYPEFWWAWREQLEPLAEAGYEVVAPDARGAGGSDKTPGRADQLTLADDIPAIAHSLGAQRAIIVGSGTAGATAWASAAGTPDTIAAIMTIGALHPAQFYRATGALHPQRVADRMRGLTYPRPARLKDADAMREFLTRWSAPDDDAAPAQAEAYACALSQPEAAGALAAQLRWAEGSMVRPAGREFRKLVARPIAQPVWAVRGIEDPTHPKANWRADAHRTRGHYRMIEVSDAGHYVPEENPEAITELILELAQSVERRES